MSEEKSEEGIDFDLDDILEDEVVEEIQLEDIEMENESEDIPESEDENSGTSFQDRVREYMGELEDETFHEQPVQVDEPEPEPEPEPETVEEIVESTDVSDDVINEVESFVF